MFKFIVRRVTQNLLALAALGMLFFICAGTTKVSGFWLYVATVLVYQIISLLVIVPKHPAYIELADVRRTRHAGAKKWDRIVVRTMAGATFLMYGLAALDVGRLHISELSMGFTLIGMLLYAVGSGLNQWAMLHNPHFERKVRIQTERAHKVMTTGPYRYVRHPGYLGSVLGFVSLPLVVGSALALLGSGICIVGMVVRTYLEDKALSQELVGYTEYAQTVRYRLIPYVW